MPYNQPPDNNYDPFTGNVTGGGDSGYYGDPNQTGFDPRHLNFPWALGNKIRDMYHNWAEGQRTGANMSSGNGPGGRGGGGDSGSRLNPNAITAFQWLNPNTASGPSTLPPSWMPSAAQSNDPAAPPGRPINFPVIKPPVVPMPVAQARPADATRIRVNSRAEYDALPQGTPYETADGIQGYRQLLYPWGLP
jgi:hypothetical protein